MGDSLDELLGLGPDPGRPVRSEGAGPRPPSSAADGPAAAGREWSDDRTFPSDRGMAEEAAPGPLEASQPDSAGTGVGSPSEVLLELSVAAIRPNPYQPRVEFDEVALAELAASIREVGILQPVIVRRIDVGRYELIAGERRWRAAQRAGLTLVPALVRAVDDRTSLEHAVVENLQRSDLNPLEEAAAYRQLIDEFSLTQDQVAQRVGKSRPAVANTLRLLQLPGSVQRLVRAGELSAGHARALLALSDSELQTALAVRAVKSGLSVRDLEELVRASGRSPRPGNKRSGDQEGGKAASVLEIERLLADRLDTRVEVSLTGSKGRLVIEFADLEDLARVYQAMAPAEAEHFDD